MNEEIAILRKEFEGAADSFIFKLRGDFVWDQEAFSTVVRAMKLVCEDMEGQESIEKWMASVYWYMFSFVKGHTMHPEFSRPFPPEYYTKAFELIEDLNFWFFIGQSPNLDPEKHFVI